MLAILKFKTQGRPSRVKGRKNMVENLLGNKMKSHEL